ncbi:MAG: PD-(D/E)XK nuclease family protein [Candidatus Poribacteria bacterium]|nr:PD-(D/E)XK nuclease family protein [Candidatus Poribacteria bacterium]
MQDIENILKTRIQNNKANTFVIIVPTDSARLKRQRELVGYHPNRAVSNLPVYTSKDFIQRLYSQTQSPKQHILSGIQHLWLHEIVDPAPDNIDTYQYNTFRPIQNTTIPDSTLSLIFNTINHLRDQGETELNFVEDDPTQVELARIYNDYEARLANQWIDEKGKHYYLANNFKEECIKRTFPNVKLVVVEGFTLISKADIKLLKHIAEISDVEMWFRTDCIEDNKALYKNIINLVSQFKDTGANIDTEYERNPDRHQYFAENLFRTNVALDHKTNLTDKIKVLEPTDRSEEVEQIAHLIQKRVLRADCKLSEICVVFYNIGNYKKRIAEVFPTYGIPYSLVESLPLMQSAVVKEIFSCLSPRQIPFGNTYFFDVKPKLFLGDFHPDAFKKSIDTFLKSAEVISKILNPMLLKNRKIVEGEVNALQQFKKIVNGLCDMLKSEENRSYKSEDYINKLKYIAKHTHYQNSTQTNEETVKIFPLSELTNLAYNNELRSLEFDTVFLGDFVEGSFPENYRPDPLLPDHPYRNEDEALHDSRFTFYRVLKSFRKRLYLLTPKREGEANLIPSPFLGQLKAIATVEKMDVSSPSRGSVTGFLSRYGDHVWTSPEPSTKEFPAEIAEMRPLINHVVKVEKSREKTHDHLAYEGILTADTLSPASQKRLENRRNLTYSVTELETYAKCPFQYFVDKVLKFRSEEDEIEDELSGLEKGSLLHDVLFEFYNNRSLEKSPPIQQCDEDTFKDAKTHLNELIEHKANEKRNDRKEKLIGENNLLWRIDIEKLRVALHKWLEAERTHDLPVVPRYFEVSFGQKREPRDPELSSTESVTIGDVRMTGKIDRIDIGNGSFNIIDYKTGSTTVRMPEILSGRSLQLPIYLQIAAELLNGQTGTGLGPAAGLYHKIRLDQCKIELGIGTESENGVAYSNYNGKDWKPVGSRSGQLLADETFDDRLARVRGYVQHYVDSISKGTFPLITRVETFVDSEEEGDTPITPKNKTEPCNYCRYKRVCRVGAISETPQSDD